MCGEGLSKKSILKCIDSTHQNKDQHVTKPIRLKNHLQGNITTYTYTFSLKNVIMNDIPSANTLGPYNWPQMIQPLFNE